MSLNTWRHPRFFSVITVAVSAALLVGACGSGGTPSSAAGTTAAQSAAAATGTASTPAAPASVAASAGGATGTVTVAMVGNPQMTELQTLKGEFESSHPGITLNILVLPENEIRAKVTTDIATGAGTFDLVTIGMYEVPLWAKQGWIDELGTALDADAAYASSDFFKSVRDGLSYNGKLYAAPFYGESSTLFYRKDLLQAAGATIPDKPTWDDVVAAAQKLKAASSSTFPICLRGLPGWGEMGAPLGTVINTFGGRWFDAKWNAQISSPETSAAIKFYIDTVKSYGEAGAISSGFTECETLLVQGKVAMWYDASSAADLLFDPKQNPDAAKLAIAYAPTKVKPDSGWLWAWAFALESTSKNKPAAIEFMKWATSKDYPLLVRDKTGGWGGAPSGARQSLYANAGYKDYAKSFADVVLGSLNTVDPLKATVFADTPYTGIQFVQIPEFQDLGTKCTQEFAGAISGTQTSDDAIAKCQKDAEDVATTGGYKQ
jgi:sorbitol/mannitol transport system substrate-binding protein